MIVFFQFNLDFDAVYFQNMIEESEKQNFDKNKNLYGLESNDVMSDDTTVFKALAKYWEILNNHNDLIRF